MEPAEHFAAHHQELIDTFRDKLASARATPEESLDALVHYLRNELLPHATAEEEELYAAVDEKCRNSLSTATMRKDHRELENRIGELSNRTDGDESWIRKKLDEFSAILLNHFHKEETILVPFLDDQLNDGDFEALLTDVHEVESRLKNGV